MKNRGLHQHRFKRNPEERRFAIAWEVQSVVGRSLAHLLDETGVSSPADPTPRDRTVAATVIQWLGSPVGQSFLKDLGYEWKGGR